jgi:neutral ceramidase
VRRHQGPSILALAWLVAACSSWHSQALPTVASRPPAGGGALRGGMSRVDITPPPGIGLGGSGPEGRRSTGYRTRLYAGALVLEDASGERIALVVGDLPHVSANLHRLVAARIEPLTGIGSDRLIISATHTHSGPAHFYSERQYNINISRVPGYDPAMVSLLVERISKGIVQATESLRVTPVALAMGRVPVAGATWNRSLAAHCLDPEAIKTAACAIDWKRPELAVDTMLFMIRVDRIKGDSTRPLGSYSIFALHGTGIPSVNTLFDGDAHLRIVERLTRHTDGLREPKDSTPTVNILANGAEGDVAPSVAREQCETPKLGPVDPAPLPRGLGERVDFVEPPPERSRHCLQVALRQLDRLAANVADPARRLYDELGTQLTSGVRIRRAFITVPLPGNDGLCLEPVTGSSTAAGGEGLETRIRGWRWLLPFVPIGLEEGHSAVKAQDGRCSSPKRELLGVLQSRLIVGEHGFPDAAQFTVVQINNVLLGAIPAEATTVAGRRMRAAMVARRPRGRDSSEAYLIGLANGFLQYVTTPEEYQWQSYEGGSTLYGPGSAPFIQRRLAELAAALPDGSGPSPPAAVGPITAYPGPASAVLPSASAGPPDPAVHVQEISCVGGHLAFTWLDLAPGRLFPRDGPLLLLELADGGKWRRVAIDGDRYLEVEAVGSRGGRGFLWSARWTRPASGQLRVLRVEDRGRIRSLTTVSCPETTARR